MVVGSRLAGNLLLKVEMWPLRKESFENKTPGLMKTDQRLGHCHWIILLSNRFLQVVFNKVFTAAYFVLRLRNNFLFLLIWATIFSKEELVPLSIRINYLSAKLVDVWFKNPTLAISHAFSYYCSFVTLSVFAHLTIMWVIQGTLHNI